MSMDSGTVGDRLVGEAEAVFGYLKRAKPCCETPCTLVKAPPIWMPPLAVIAETPTGLPRTSGFHPSSAPCASESASALRRATGWVQTSGLPAPLPPRQ